MGKIYANRNIIVDNPNESLEKVKDKKYFISPKDLVSVKIGAAYKF